VADHLIAGLHCADLADDAAAFVLGALEPARAAAVRAHLSMCPEPHPEMAELGGVLPALFESIDPITPPADLGARIRAAADAERAAAQAAPTMPRPAHVAVQQRPSRAPERQAGGFWTGLFRRPVWAAATLVAALALVALGAWNVQLRDQVAGLQTYRDGVATVLDQAARPGAQLAVLAPGSGTAGPSGLAVVGADGSLSLVMKDLRPTSGAQVYEAWVIAGKAAPVPIAGFTVGAGGAGSLTASHAPLGQGVTVALTLEPGPGATTPTLPIVVAGVAAAQSS
jgi:hypothetical protein